MKRLNNTTSSINNNKYILPIYMYNYLKVVHPKCDDSLEIKNNMYKMYDF